MNRFIPGTLRGRLVVSYMTLTAVSLSVLFAALVALGVQRYVRSTMLAIDNIAVPLRANIDGPNWGKPDATLIAMVSKIPHPAAVRVVIIPRRPPGIPPPPGTPGGAQPPAMPGAFTPVGTTRVPVALGRPAGGPRDRALSSVFHLETRVIFLHEGAVIIGPAIPIENVLGLAVLVLGIGVAAALLVSAAIGRWITDQAIEPLVTVTGELRRFADGDFTASVLNTTERGELASLVSAFNGAAAQVSAAFSERERTEKHLRLFLGEAGHEMRTPLTVISAYLEMIDTGSDADAILTAAQLKTLRTESRRLRALVERVMALARLQGDDRSHTELVDVTAAINDVVAEATAVQGGDVRLTVPDEDVFVVAEPWELHEAVGNLVDNALRYGAGSVVNVSVDRVNDDVIVRVVDRGPGITDADAAQLFRHFFRGEQSAGTQGSGLGLAIVARAAERLRGTVALERDDVTRTAFSLTMPLYRSG